MPERTEIGLLLVKAEATYGTDPTPTQAANIIPTVRDQLTWDVQSDFSTRMVLDGTFEPSAGYVTKPFVTLKFRYELRGNRKNGTTELDISNGTNTQAVELDALLKACALLPTYTAAVTPGVESSSAGSRDGSVAYITSASTINHSVTCWWYSEEKLHKLVGGKGDLSVVMEAGRMAYLDFTITGKYVTITDNTFALSSHAFLATKPPVWESGSLSLGGVSTLVAQNLTINLGNRIVPRWSATAADNLAGFVNAGISPNGRLNPESIPEATLPIWTDWRTNVTLALSATVGTSVGNRISVAATTQLKKVSYENGSGVRLQPVEFDIVKAVPVATPSNIFYITFS